MTKSEIEKVKFAEGQLGAVLHEMVDDGSLIPKNLIAVRNTLREMLNDAAPEPTT